MLLQLTESLFFYFQGKMEGEEDVMQVMLTNQASLSNQLAKYKGYVGHYKSQCGEYQVWSLSSFEVSCLCSTKEEFAQIVSSLLGHRSAVDGVNIEFLWIGAVFACD